MRTIGRGRFLRRDSRRGLPPHGSHATPLQIRASVWGATLAL